MAQQWDQLRQMVMRMQHNLEQQIQARYTKFMRQSHETINMNYYVLCGITTVNVSVAIETL